MFPCFAMTVREGKWKFFRKGGGVQIQGLGKGLSLLIFRYAKNLKVWR